MAKAYLKIKVEMGRERAVVVDRLRALKGIKSTVTDLVLE